jgi:hypothetical protein
MDELRARGTELRQRILRSIRLGVAECYAGAFIALRTDGTTAALGWVGAVAAAAVVGFSLWTLHEVNGVLRGLDR